MGTESRRGGARGRGGGGQSSGLQGDKVLETGGDDL